MSRYDKTGPFWRLDFRQTGHWRGKEPAETKRRLSVEQIVATLKQIELGVTAAAASRQLGVSEQAVCHWKKVYGDLQSGQARELKLLQ